ncbi:uncharacterized protein G2W53_039662 [Senna tora]|uniref:Uncharacterized protein n=1 Tax=Senna tora TaxID=362788 RepID=A0A834W6C2_9FABA|nr:uncharacterized protein G2W53_039662 [Senna tora]
MNQWNCKTRKQKKDGGIESNDPNGNLQTRGHTSGRIERRTTPNVPHCSAHVTLYTTQRLPRHCTPGGLRPQYIHHQHHRHFGLLRPLYNPQPNRGSIGLYYSQSSLAHLRPETLPLYPSAVPRRSSPSSAVFAVRLHVPGLPATIRVRPPSCSAPSTPCVRVSLAVHLRTFAVFQQRPASHALQSAARSALVYALLHPQPRPLWLASTVVRVYTNLCYAELLLFQAARVWSAHYDVNGRFLWDAIEITVLDINQIHVVVGVSQRAFKRIKLWFLELVNTWGRPFEIAFWLQMYGWLFIIQNLMERSSSAARPFEPRRQFVRPPSSSALFAKLQPTSVSVAPPDRALKKGKQYLQKGQKQIKQVEDYWKTRPPAPSNEAGQIKQVTLKMTRRPSPPKKCTGKICSEGIKVHQYEPKCTPIVHQHVQQKYHPLKNLSRWPERYYP